MRTTRFFGLMLFALAIATTACTNANDPEPEPEPVVTNGLGTEASPYSVAGGIANQGSSKWVKGYIVGYAWSATVGASFTFTADTCMQATNLLIAGSKTEKDATKCLIVQLPAGVIRTGLNLKDVKTNLGKEVTLYGSLEAYFSQPGLKTVSYYALEGGTTGGTKPVDITNALFSETFAASLGTFTTQSVSGDQVWAYSSQYKYVMISGYVSPANFANEDWLISPDIDLSKVTAAKLSFDHVARYFGNFATEPTIWVSTDYTAGLPSTGTWIQLITKPFSDPGIWTLASSGEISLKAYAGKKIKIAFKYLSTATKAGTWEMKNFLVQEGEATIIPDPVSIFAETFATSIGAFTNQSVVGEQVWAFSTSYKCAVMSGYINATKLYVANEDWLISPEIDLSTSTAPKLAFDHVTAYFGDVANETTVWVSENYTSGLPSTATWIQLTTPPFVSATNYTFGNSGEISLASFAGKKIKISFKYISSSTKAGTWEIKNLVVK